MQYSGVTFQKWVVLCICLWPCKLSYKTWHAFLSFRGQFSNPVLLQHGNGTWVLRQKDKVIHSWLHPPRDLCREAPPNHCLCPRGTFQPWYTSNPSFIYLISSSSLIFLPPDMVNLKFLKKKIQECCHCPSPTQLIELFFYYYYYFLISVFNTRQQLLFHLLFLKPCAHDITWLTTGLTATKTWFLREEYIDGTN